MCTTAHKENMESYCMSRSKTQLPGEENESFLCVHCGNTVVPSEYGTEHRNHCPHCLWSVHVDIRPGDRRSGCRGEMEPIGVWIKGRREWSLIHRCKRCGLMRTNRIAGDDDEVRLFSLAARPLTEMPFPSEQLFSRLTKESFV